MHLMLPYKRMLRILRVRSYILLLLLFLLLVFQDRPPPLHPPPPEQTSNDQEHQSCSHDPTNHFFLRNFICSQMSSILHHLDSSLGVTVVTVDFIGDLDLVGTTHCSCSRSKYVELIQSCRG